MTAWNVKAGRDFVLLPNPNRLKVKKNAVYCDKTQHANFRGGFIFQATKQQLNGEKWDTKQQLNGEKGDVEYLPASGSAALLCCFGVQGQTFKMGLGQLRHCRPCAVVEVYIQTHLET